MSQSSASFWNGDNNGQSCEKSYANTGSARKPPEAPAAGQRLIAKFNYDAKADSPLGRGAELSFKRMDKMRMVRPHGEQDYWWLVRKDDGREGYVPGNYVTVFEEKVTSLPWLAGKVLDPLPQDIPLKEQPYKPYKSAYAAKCEVMAVTVNSYTCDVCQKSFNGPHPYNTHMASRAHREEIEIQAAYRYQ